MRTNTCGKLTLVGASLEITPFQFATPFQYDHTQFLATLFICKGPEAQRIGNI